MCSVCLPMQALSFVMGWNTGRYFLGQKHVIRKKVYKRSESFPS